MKLFANFRDKAGESSTRIQANTADELLDKLVAKYGELEDLLVEKDFPELKLKGGVTVMLNGRNVQFLDGPDTELSQGDTVAIFPPIGGG